MSLRQVLQQVIAATLVMLFLVGCGSVPPTSVSEIPTATFTPELAAATPEPSTSTPTAVPSTATPIPTPTATEPPPTPTPQPNLLGKIFDQETGQPIADANVSIGNQTVTTNANGEYVLTDLPPGQYVLSVSHEGYDPGLSAIFTLAVGMPQTLDLALYPSDTTPYPEDPMLTNPLDPNGAPNAEDAERLARLQGLTGEVVSIKETKLINNFLVNYKVGDDIRAAVANLNHEVWELIDDTGQEWFIIKVCGNLASRLPKGVTIPTPQPRPLPLLAEVVVDELTVYACASEECEEVTKVQRGMQIEVGGCLADGSWCQVSLDGKSGWCTGSSLQQLAVAEAVPVVEAVLPPATPGIVATGQGKIVFTCEMHDCQVKDDGTCLTHPVDGSIVYDVKIDICVVNTDSSGLTRLTNDEVEDRYPAWSPDKTRIAFSRDLDDIYVMNADGSNLTPLTYSPDSSDNNPTWSPDGQQIAFCSEPKQNVGGGIYVMNFDGSGLIRLTDPQIWACHPAWSPDGTKIAFVNISNGGIHVMNVDGSNLMHLTEKGDYPKWSSDGRKIVFFDNVSLNNDEVFVINADGTGLARLTDHPDLDGWPDWSPDDQKIVFESGPTGDAHIYMMNMDGSNVTLLFEDQIMSGGLTRLVQGFYPDW